MYEFEAEVLVLYHSTTIARKYQAMLHCGCVRQTAKIVGMDKEFIRTGDRAIVHFAFLRHPEYVRVGSRFVFREGLFVGLADGAGRTKGLGKISKLFPLDKITTAAF